MEREFIDEFGKIITCKYDVDTDTVTVKNEGVDENFYILTHTIESVEEGVVVDIQEIPNWEEDWTEDVRTFIGNFYRENKVEI
jgi:hypothetical protein